jgi:hypothetical protein
MPNESLIHADVFFFISTIALVIISVGIIIALAYGIKILRNVKEISERVKEESVEILADVKTLRHALRDEGLKWKHVIDLVRNFFVRKGNKVKKMTDKISKLL